jgi:hypothetical protein
VADFIYTAKRSVLPHHIIDQEYEIEIGVSDEQMSRSVEKNEVRAKGGATETLYHRADVEWSITFEPVGGDRLDALLEFLDSTESGEPFEMRLYGTESRFTTVKRSDTGYTRQAFQRQGSERADLFQLTISVRAT